LPAAGFLSVSFSIAKNGLSKNIKDLARGLSKFGDLTNWDSDFNGPLNSALIDSTRLTLFSSSFFSSTTCFGFGSDDDATGFSDDLSCDGDLVKTFAASPFLKIPRS